MNSSKIISLLLLLFSFTSYAQKTDRNNQNEELGTVSWYRDYQTAIAQSKKEKKPILILFQEVPGCSTCRNYGHNVLSNPLLVEAIEELFIPLAIFNNKGGKDKAVLTKFNEPTWNNPVVRIINFSEQQLTNRIAGNYSAYGLYSGMVNALKKENKTIPTYLKLIGEELKASKFNQKKEKYYKMYCFWNGEKQLGKIDGVLHTESGFMKHSEVVKVSYNPLKITDNELNKIARQNNFEPLAKDNSYRKSTKDVHYYLRHSEYKYLPLTDLQKTKINSALATRSSVNNFLSPKQKHWMSQIQQNKLQKVNLIDQDVSIAWKKYDH